MNCFGLTCKKFQSCVPSSVVVLHGWIRSVRAQKQDTFISLNDGTCQENIQLVCKSDALHGLQIGTGASVRVTGVVVTSNKVKEMHVEEMKVLGACEESYPLQKKRHSLDTLRNKMLTLRPRSNTISSMLRIRGAIIAAMHEFFLKNDFLYIQTPILTALDCEGADVNAAEPDYFNEKVHLTVSGQLHAEMIANAISRVYTLGPTFRAEKSNTYRHLSEFWMLEPEMAFADLNTVIDTSEGLLHHVFNHLLDNCFSDLTFFNDFYDKKLISRLQSFTNKYHKISYSDAVELIIKKQLEGEKFENTIKWGLSLQTEHEKFLAAYFDGPVFVTDYPKEVKSFYMKLNSDSKTVACTDLLFPQMGELIGGSAREDSLGTLEARMKEVGLDQSSYSWYTDLRKYGGAPHAGFGLGLERLVLLSTGLENIRDVTIAPRYYKSCKL